MNSSAPYSKTEYRSATTEPTQGDTEPGIFSLLETLRREAGTWISQETELVKSEVSGAAKTLTRNLALLALSVSLLITGSISLLLTLAFGISFLLSVAGIAAPASYLLGFIAVSVLTLLTGITLLKKSKKGISPRALMPSRTLETLKETSDWAKEKIK